MDEMSTIRRLLAEDSPHPHIVEKGRERLFGSPPRVVRTRRIRRAAVRSALGLGAAGAAAALLVAALVPEGTSPRGGRPPTADGAARNVLLAAAESAESAPTSGSYWHVRRMFRTTFPRELGRGDNRYTVEVLSVTEVWTTRSGQSWMGNREWVRPKSAEDEAAWRRDGSPSKWCMGKTDTEPPRPNCLHTAPGTASLVPVGDDTFIVSEGRELTFDELQRLPADPAELRAWVVDAAKDDLDPSVSAAILNQNVAAVLGNLLVDVPAPPDVRAAAYRALADMPNVKSTGATHDQLGRAGSGIVIHFEGRGNVVMSGAATRTFEAGELTRVLIIDPETSHVLADQISVDEGVTAFLGTLILEVGWTNEKPHRPEMP